MFHFGNVFCVLDVLIGGTWGGLAGAVGMTISDLITAYVTKVHPKTFYIKIYALVLFRVVLYKLFKISRSILLSILL